MKKDPSRSPSQSKPLPTRHQFDHEVPTHIHDPEEDMMVLARWTHRAMRNPTKFWGAILVIAAGLLALVLLSNVVWTGSSGNAEVWSKLETAKSPVDRVKLAEDFPNSLVATWARLQAATEYYNQGFTDLPNNRDVALPTLKKALDSFDEVAREAPKDSPQARAAALGKARTLEARNDLAKAIEQYQLVEKTWPGSAEAAQAKQLAAALQKPEAATFYKELYTYSPTRVTLPPLGSQSLDMPLAPAPGTGFSSFPAEANPGGEIPSIPLLPPPPPSPVTKGEPAPSKGSDAGKTTQPAAPGGPAPAAGLPESPFDPGGLAPKAQPASPPTPKAETPRAESKPAASKAEKPKS